jgi:CBS domain-containing protein
MLLFLLRNICKKICKFDTWVTFSLAVNEASRRFSVVRRFEDDLKEFAELRNAIVHDRGGGYVIAEPNFRAVESIEQILEIITNPPRVIPSFQVEVLAFDIYTPVSEAIVSMASRDFSQVPITDKDNFKALLTTNTITRWLGLTAKDDIFCLSETAIGKVLEYSELLDNYKFISKKTTLFEAMEAFQSFENQGKRLDAALITESGKAKEKIIGIVTVADFPKMIHRIGI